MGKKRIYISGPVTGTTDYMERFAQAEKKIAAAGHEAVNPAKVIAQLPPSVTWEQCMQLSMVMLDMCDAVYLMEGWTNSKGAVKELKHAIRHGKMVLYEECHDSKQDKESENGKRTDMEMRHKIIGAVSDNMTCPEEKKMEAAAAIADTVMDAIDENYRSITEIHSIVEMVRAGYRVQIDYFDPDEDDFMDEFVARACW